MKRGLIFLLFLAISLSFMGMSIEQNAYDLSYYSNFYKKNNIEAETGRTEDELEKISEDIISYLKGRGGNELLTPYFNDREVLHMEDVQDLFTLNRIFKYIGIAIYLILLIYFHRKRDYRSIGQSFFILPFLNYIIFIVLFFLASNDFNKYFTYFHRIFFNNDLWLLDPNKDLMIQMLPESFFMGMAKNICLSFLIYMVILQIVGYLYMRKGKRDGKKTNRKNKRVLHKK